LTSCTLEEVHDVEFEETKGFEEEDENLDDMRDTHLVYVVDTKIWQNYPGQEEIS
jgi:hypothetical protein